LKTRRTVKNELPFYRRVDQLFVANGTTRRKFCLAHGIAYSTLSTYWHSDVFPPGEMMVALAESLGASLDFLVWGKGARPERVGVNRIVDALSNLTDKELDAVYGAVMQFLTMTGMNAPGR